MNDLSDKATFNSVQCLFCAIEEWKWKRAQRAAAAPKPT